MLGLAFERLFERVVEQCGRQGEADDIAQTLAEFFEREDGRYGSATRRDFEAAVGLAIARAVGDAEAKTGEMVVVAEVTLPQVVGRECPSLDEVVEVMDGLVELYPDAVVMDAPVNVLRFGVVGTMGTPAVAL